MSGRVLSLARGADAIARTVVPASETLFADPQQVSGAAREPEDDSWLAMVAADPALYLKDPGGTEAKTVKRTRTEEELIERWTLAPDELPLLANKRGATRLGFAVLLRFFAGEGRFPTGKGEVPGRVVAYLGRQVGVPTEEYLRYDWRGRAIKYHRAQVRAHFGFREPTAEDGKAVAA
jgi:hypothetical protein